MTFVIYKLSLLFIVLPFKDLLSLCVRTCTLPNRFICISVASRSN